MADLFQYIRDGPELLDHLVELPGLQSEDLADHIHDGLLTSEAVFGVENSP